MSALPPLRALRYFHQAALQQSFSLAAQSLHVTHSAISHQIKLLETWLGKSLFLRAGGRVQLTSDGERLKICCEQAFGELEATCEKIRDRPQNGLTVSCAPSFLAQWLIPRIGRFSLRYPDIPLTFQTHVDRQRLASGQCDVLIASHQTVSGEMTATLIAADDIGPVCSPAFAERFRPGMDFASLPLLHADSRAHAWSEWAEKTGAAGDFRAGNRFDNLTLAIQAARSGLGVTVAPQMLVKKELAEGSLIAPLGFSRMDRATWMIVKAGRNEEAEIALFRDWLLEEVAASDEVAL